MKLLGRRRKLKRPPEPGVDTPRGGWPYPPVGKSLLLGLGIALLTLCLWPFLGAIACAAVFAFGLRQPLLNAYTRFGMGKGVFVTLVFAALMFVLMMPISIFGLRLYQMTAAPRDSSVPSAFSGETMQKMSQSWKRVESAIARYGVTSRMYEDTSAARSALRDSVSGIGKKAFAIISASLTQLPDLVVTFLVFCLFLGLFLTHARRIQESILRLGIFRPDELGRTVQVLQRSCYDAIVSNVVVGVVQATVVTAGARIFGYQELVLIFSVVFFLSFIPFIGAAPVAFVLAAVSFAMGETGNGIGLVVTGLVAGTVDNVVRPYLISNGETEVHPILSFAAILGAIAIFGLKGIFIGPVILTASFGLLFSPGTEGGARTVELPRRNEAGEAPSRRAQ